MDHDYRDLPKPPVIAASPGAPLQRNPRVPRYWQVPCQIESNPSDPITALFWPHLWHPHVAKCHLQPFPPVFHRQLNLPAFRRPSIKPCRAWFLPTAATACRQIGHLQDPRDRCQKPETKIDATRERKDGIPIFSFPILTAWVFSVWPAHVAACLGSLSPGRFSQPPKQELQKPVKLARVSFNSSKTGS